MKHWIKIMRSSSSTSSTTSIFQWCVLQQGSSNIACQICCWYFFHFFYWTWKTVCYQHRISYKLLQTGAYINILSWVSKNKHWSYSFSCLKTSRDRVATTSPSQEIYHEHEWISTYISSNSHMPSHKTTYISNINLKVLSVLVVITFLQLTEVGRFNQEWASDLKQAA